MNRLKNGTLVEFHSGGNTYFGLVIGTCSYDNLSEDNAYAIRYVWIDNYLTPRRPYTIAAMDSVRTVKEFPEDFYIGAGWQCTPDDRCDEWIRVIDPQTENILIIPVAKAK